MKFHELVQHHNIDYKFHDIQDLHPVYENKSDSNPILPESGPTFSDFISTFNNVVNIEDELKAFRTFQKTEVAKKQFVASVLNIENKSKEKKLSNNDLKLFYKCYKQFVDSQLSNEQNQKSFLTSLQENFVTFKSFCIQILNALREQNYSTAVKIFFEGLWGLMKYIGTFVNKSNILRLVVLAAFAAFVIYYRPSTVTVQQQVKNVLGNATDFILWFWKVVTFDQSAELRDSILGNFNTTLQQQTENAVNEWNIDLNTLNTKKMQIATGLMGSVAAIAATGPGWLFATGWAAITGGLYFVNSRQEMTANPQDLDMKINLIRDMLTSQQSEEGVNLMRSVITNPLFVQYVLKPCFLSLISIMTRILYLKTSEKEQEQQADQIIKFSEETIKSYESIAKANTRARNTIANLYNEVLATKQQARTTTLDFAGESARALFEAYKAKKSENIENNQDLTENQKNIAKETLELKDTVRNFNLQTLKTLARPNNEAQVIQFMQNLKILQTLFGKTNSRFEPPTTAESKNNLSSYSYAFVQLRF